jgi:hypothetical protein
LASAGSRRSGPGRYRGRFRQLNLIVDQISDDDTFTARALSGEVEPGRWGFLRAVGLTRRYLIIHPPVDTLDLSPAAPGVAADPLVWRCTVSCCVARANAGVTDLAMGPGLASWCLT